jgi:hypothetical protein
MNSVYISSLPSTVTASDLATVLYDRILIAERITLLPYVCDKGVFQKAYIAVASWADCEEAWHICAHIKRKTTSQFTFKQPWTFILQANALQSFDPTEHSALAPFTTHFDQEFYLNEQQEDEEQEDDEKQSLNYAFLEEVLNYSFLDSCEDEDDWLYIQEELEAYRKYNELELIDEEFLESVLYGKPPAAAAATVY